MQPRRSWTMYGKHFASMYTGSMYGKPALVFAVWGYVISHMRQSRKDKQCYVELHPALLAGVFDTTADEVLVALELLESPDPSSRSKVEEGRRLSLLSEERIVGPLQYRVVNGEKYRAMRDEEERRAYLTEAKRVARSSTKSKNVNRRRPASTVEEQPSTLVIPSEPPSTQSEAEAEAEPEADPSSSEASPPQKSSEPQAKQPSERKGLVGECALAYLEHYGYEPTWGQAESVCLNALGAKVERSVIVGAFRAFLADQFEGFTGHSPLTFRKHFSKFRAKSVAPRQARVEPPRYCSCGHLESAHRVDGTCQVDTRECGCLAFLPREAA